MRMCKEDAETWRKADKGRHAEFPMERSWTEREKANYEKLLQRQEVSEVPGPGDLVLVWDKEINPNSPVKTGGEGLELGVVHTLRKAQYRKNKMIKIGYVSIDDSSLNRYALELLNEQEIERRRRHRKKHWKDSSEEEIEKSIKWDIKFSIKHRKVDDTLMRWFYREIESNIKHAKGIALVPLSFVADIIEKEHVKI